MKFKIDENLPIDVAILLRSMGYDAITVVEQNLGGALDPVIASVSQQEERVLITVDTDFADIRAYPPGEFPGLIVLRLHQQDKEHVLAVVEDLIAMFTEEPLKHLLWIAEETQVRIRS